MDKAAAHVGLKHGACAAPGRHRHPELLRVWRRRRGGNCDANETVWPEVEGDLDLHHLPADVGLDPLAGLHPRRTAGRLVRRLAAARGQGKGGAGES